MLEAVVPTSQPASALHVPAVDESAEHIHSEPRRHEVSAHDVSDVAMKPLERVRPSTVLPLLSAVLVFAERLEHVDPHRVCEEPLRDLLPGRDDLLHRVRTDEQLVLVGGVDVMLELGRDAVESPKLRDPRRSCGPPGETQEDGFPVVLPLCRDGVVA